jgi:hypothetical protein
MKKRLGGPQNQNDYLRDIQYNRWTTNSKTHWTGGWVGSRPSLEAFEKTKISCPYQETNHYSFKYNQQDAALFSILYYCQCSTCFERFLCPSPGDQKLHTASGICQACLLLLLAWVKPPSLAVAASKLDIYVMLCVQFLSCWWWEEKLPETGRALTIIKNTE